MFFFGGDHNQNTSYVRICVLAARMCVRHKGALTPVYAAVCAYICMYVHVCVLAARMCVRHKGALTPVYAAVCLWGARAHAPPPLCSVTLQCYSAVLPCSVTLQCYSPSAGLRGGLALLARACL